MSEKGHLLPCHWSAARLRDSVSHLCARRKRFVSGCPPLLVVQEKLEWFSGHHLWQYFFEALLSSIFAL